MPMQQILSSQASPEIIINENFESLDHLAVYARNPATTSALTWGYYGGRWAGFAVTSATLTLTASANNYIVVSKTDGVISVSTTTTNWNNATDYARVYLVVTGTTSVTSYEDHRVGGQGIFATPISVGSPVTVDTAQTITGAKRGAITTDNDLSFDMSVGNNFHCTTSGSGTLTFTNITAGQSGFILLTNASNHSISAAATTKVNSGTLTTISTTGTYLLSYFSDATDVYVVNSGAFL
jgi:hypothetical protein